MSLIHPSTAFGLPAPAVVPPACSVESGEACAPTPESGAKPPENQATPASPPSAATSAGEPSRSRLVFYWAVACPRCEDAKPFVRRLAHERPGLQVEWVEVRTDASGRRRFLEHMHRLGASGAGVPAFVVGGRYVIGFRAGVTEEAVLRLVDDARASTTPTARIVDLPLIGRLDAGSLPFPVFTLLIGLVDGLNPCAMWVLLVMLSVLLRVRSRVRLVVFGGVFVVMSGVVYFLFMTAWVALFTFGGMSRELTRLLGAALLVMGAINLKEIVWFKRGVSLMVPERAKPGLYRRMRAIAGSASVPAALVGVTMLALVVNLIELGCTIGLPAVYTRLLTLRADLSPLGRYAYLALYNAAYVVPLGSVVLLYVVTLHRLSLSERGAKVLKAISGLLLVTFGGLFVLTPEILG